MDQKCLPCTDCKGLTLRRCLFKWIYLDGYWYWKWCILGKIKWGLPMCIQIQENLNFQEKYREINNLYGQWFLSITHICCFLFLFIMLSKPTCTLSLLRANVEHVLNLARISAMKIKISVVHLRWYLIFSWLSLGLHDSNSTSSPSASVSRIDVK